MEPLSADSALAARISAELAKHAELHKTPIEVIVDRGLVTLEGRVHSEEVKARVEEIARSLAGDASVVSEIEVKVHDPLRGESFPLNPLVPPPNVQ